MGDEHHRYGVTSTLVHNTTCAHTNVVANLCNVRNHHYHCFLAQACLPQPGEVLDADTPCVAIGNNHNNHIHPHCHYHYLRQDFHHRLSLIGVYLVLKQYFPL